MKGRGWTHVAVAGLLAVLALQAVLSMRHKNVTIDEITYMAAGTYHLRTGDFHYNQTNPALLKMWTAAPLVAMGAELPALTESPRGWRQVEQWQYARRFLYENHLDPDRMLFAARLPSVVLALVLGALVFGFARELYGERGGLLALALYVLSPNILAHARLGTQDIGMAMLLFASAWSFWRLLVEPAAGRLLLCGTLIGLCFAAKTPTVLGVGVLLVYAGLCVLRGNGLGTWEGVPGLSRLPEVARLRQLASFAVIFAALAGISLFVLNLVYGFQGSFELWHGVPVPLPSAYFEGILFLFSLESKSGGVFFGGELYPGLWYLIPASMLIKTPIPILLLVGAALLGLVPRIRQLECEWLLLGFAGAFVLVFTVFSNAVEGLRYVLPAYPFAFVLVGSLLAPDRPRGRLRSGLIAAACVGCAVVALRIHPHYLAYFNELVGGPENGHRWLAGSSLDWGQDLKGLAAYMEEHDIERIKLGYFGSGDAGYYGIDYDYLPSVGLAPTAPGDHWWYEYGEKGTPEVAPQTGWIAVSASLLAGQQWVGPMFGDAYRWLEGHEPVDQVGHTILIYHIEGGDSSP